MPLSSLTTPQYNAELRALSKEIAAAVQQEGRSQSIGSSARATGQGLSSIKGFTKSSRGEVNRLGIRFKRHLIFVEHGVGRGQKVGQSGARRPKPFLSTGVDRFHSRVADTVARYHGDDFVRVNDKALKTLTTVGSSIRITTS